MTPVSHGKPCAGNPHARFEEGVSAPEKPRRNALLHDLTDKHTFTCKTKYGDYEDCYFKAGHYQNGNVAILIESGEDEEPIMTATVNPWQEVSDDCVAIKNYSENEGIVDVLKEQGIITGEPEYEIPSGYVVIPVYKLADGWQEKIAAFIS